jgi:uncharacterized protein YlxW (UPF0749 family)
MKYMFVAVSVTIASILGSGSVLAQSDYQIVQQLNALEVANAALVKENAALRDRVHRLELNKQQVQKSVDTLSQSIQTLQNSIQSIQSNNSLSIQSGKLVRLRSGSGDNGCIASGQNTVFMRDCGDVDTQVQWSVDPINK